MPNPSNTSNPSLSAADFLKLAAQSGLLTPQQCRQLQVHYHQAAVGAAADTAEALAQWLVSQKHLSRYQAKVLLAGKPGPFLYGAYKVLERLSQGPFQGCFRAVHATSGHPVLLQFLAGEHVKDPRKWLTTTAWLTRFCSLEHPRLHRWYEWVDLGNYKFLVAEELPGRPLSELIKEGRVQWPRAGYLVQQAAEGLQAVHQAGLVHGDIRPENLWLDSTGGLKVLLQPVLPATRLAPANELTQADYRAPELANPNRAADALSDIYALGCTLYDLLTARPPFPGGDVASKMHRHATEAIQSLEPFGVPASLAQVVIYMMAKNPSVRLKTMGDVVGQLAPLAGDEAHRLPPSSAPSTLPSYLEYVQQQPWKAAAATEAAAAPLAAPAPLAARPASAAPVATAPMAQAPAPIAQPIATPVAPRVPIEIRADDRRRPARRRRSNLAALLVIAAVLAVLGFFGWRDGATWIAMLNKSSPSNTPKTDAQKADGNTTTTGDGPAIIADDGKSLWASPTNGSAIDFAGVPPDSRLMLFLRPADLAAHPEGERLVQALGPVLSDLLPKVETITRVPLSNIEQLLVSWHDAGDQPPRVAMVVRIRQPVKREQLMADWGNPVLEQVPESDSFYAGSDWSYHLPGPADQEDVRQFTIGRKEEITSLAANRGAPPLPPKGLEAIVRVSDNTRMLSIFFVPQFLRSTLLRDGREFYFGSSRRLLEPIDAFLGDGVRGGMLSLHLADQFYLELTLSTDVSRDRYSLAEDLRNHLRALPRKIEDYLAPRMEAAAYWGKVALRLPQMIQFLADYARVSVEDKLVVANAVLPDVAAHNLAFGAEMLLASSGNSSSSSQGSGSTSSEQPMAGPKTIEELLNEKTTIRFDRTNLEFALNDITEDVRDSFPKLPFEFDIKIIGPDLEKGGITRNQPVAEFSIENQPISEVLTKLVMRCNPDPAVTEPSDPKQALVWVVADDPSQAGRRIVLITTREGAELRDNSLPPVFQLKP